MRGKPPFVETRPGEPANQLELVSPTSDSSLLALILFAAAMLPLLRMAILLVEGNWKVAASERVIGSVTLEQVVAAIAGSPHLMHHLSRESSLVLKSPE
jgi:hypothetical protein